MIIFKNSNRSVSFLLLVLSIWIPFNGQPILFLKAAENKMPIVFNFGQSYKDTKKDLINGKIMFEKKGELIQVKNESLEYQYFFFLKRRVKEIKLKKMIIDKKERMVLSDVLMEDAHPQEESTLYAVSIVFPMIVFEDEIQKAIMNRLTPVYGTAKGLEGAAFTMENKTTLVTGYVSNYGNKRCLLKITFSSRSLSDERIKYINNLRITEQRIIDDELEKANKKIEEETKKK
jgi:hypothetical protein